MKYPFRVHTAFGPWTAPPRKIALFPLKTNCGLGPFDPCIGDCSAGCTGVSLRDIAPDATLASDPKLIHLIVPTLAQQVAVCRATRKLHGANLGELCKRLLTNPPEVTEKILATSLHAPFDTPIDEIIFAQARLRASRCALTQAALEVSEDLPLTFVVTSADTTKSYSSLELEDGQIGVYSAGSNLLGETWEQVRNGGTAMLKEPFHIICTSAEKPFFDGSAAVVHVADDQLQKTRFFENNRFSGSCIAALVTLGKAERSPDESEDLFDQLMAAIKKAPHLQVVVLPPPPFPTDAYVYQAKQLRLNFPDTYEMTDSGGSLLQIGRYGAHADRHLASGNKWDKDGILALKAYLVQVLGHHWLRKQPKANATFPLRQLHQLGLAAPESQPSTSTRPAQVRLQPTRLDARLHTTRGGPINRHAAPARSGSRSTDTIDPQFLNGIISALQPGHQQQRRFQPNKRGKRQ
ncbi:hypothetical protein AAVH_22194 [Aphelenchoides avenae]|nr:hypothetical protein AAVH_22194 [Aphelenchus avenae]